LVGIDETNFLSLVSTWLDNKGSVNFLVLGWTKQGLCVVATQSWSKSSPVTWAKIFSQSSWRIQCAVSLGLLVKPMNDLHRSRTRTRESGHEGQRCCNRGTSLLCTPLHCTASFVSCQTIVSVSASACTVDPSHRFARLTSHDSHSVRYALLFVEFVKSLNVLSKKK